MKKLLTFLLLAALCFGDSSGPLAGTGAGTSWTNPTNIASSNNAYATYSLCGECVSDGLYGSGLGFAVTGTVVGIEVTLERKCNATFGCYSSGTDGITSAGVWLTKSAGVSQGTNKGTATAWTTADVTQTLGSSSDLWGSTWTTTEINDAGFGPLLKVYNAQSGATLTPSVDYLAVTVYYTPGGAGSHRRVIISQTRTVRIPRA